MLSMHKVHSCPCTNNNMYQPELLLLEKPKTIRCNRNNTLVLALITWAKISNSTISSKTLCRMRKCILRMLMIMCAIGDGMGCIISSNRLKVQLILLHEIQFNNSKQVHHCLVNSATCNFNRFKMYSNMANSHQHSVQLQDHCSSHLVR